MKTFVVRISTVSAILGVVIGTAWYAMSPTGRKERGSPDSPPPVVIRTGTPIRRDFEATKPWIGRTESKQVARIVALEEGKLVSIDAEDEAKVEKGSVLFTISGPRLDTRLEAAKQEVSSLRRRVTLAEHVVERKESVVKQMIAKQAELDTAEAQLWSLEAQLKSAAGTRQRLEDATQIVAPIAGVFTKRIVSAGQDVGKGAVLAEVIDSAHVRVVATLFPPGDAVLQGRTATVRAMGGGGILGTVTRVLPERTAAGGTVVWLEGDALDQHLLPGERVGGDILLSTHKATLAVPEKAVVLDQHERAYVFLRQAAGYERREVQSGLVSDGWVEIVSGIQEDDTIVVLGAYELYYRDFSHLYKVAD